MYELIRKSFWEKNLIQGVFIYASLPPPPPPGLLFMDSVGNKRNKIAAYFWWSRQGMIKHPLSFSHYFRSSFKQKLSQQQPAIWVKSQTVSTLFASSIQIEYLLIKNISYDYKNWQSGWWSANGRFYARDVKVVWDVKVVLGLLYRLV